MPDNSPPLSYLISSSSTLCVAVIFLLLFGLFQPILLCFYSSSTCFHVWCSAYSTGKALCSSDFALIIGSISLISADLFFHLDTIWYNAFEIYGKGTPFFMNAIRIKAGGVSFVNFFLKVLNCFPARALLWSSLRVPFQTCCCASLWLLCVCWLRVGSLSLHSLPNKTLLPLNSV